MTFQGELTDLRAEVRLDTAGRVIYWAKVDGANVAAEAVSNAPVAYAYDPQGALLGQCTLAHSTTTGVSQLTATILAAWADELGENFRVDFTFRPTGTSTDHTVSVPFDVVMAPFFDAVSVAMNDLTDEWADAEKLLAKLAAIQLTGRTAAQLGAAVAQQGAREVRVWLKKRVEGEGYGWPVYVVNVDDVKPVVVARALYKLAVLGRADPEVITYWNDESRARFDGLPKLQFSTNDDKVQDAEVSASFRNVKSRRSW